jgi:glucose-6-phosphate 1-dehydrogenase
MSLANQNAQIAKMAFCCQFCYGQRCHYDLDKRKLFPAHIVSTHVSSSQEGLAIVVVGASGDLAKKKTYPSLLQLYKDGLLPDDTIIWGFARTVMTHVELRKRLRPHLVNDSPQEVVDRFLEICFYTQGKSYGDLSAYRKVVEYISEHEQSLPTKIHHNRLFYLAIPPNVFGETGMVR